MHSEFPVGRGFSTAVKRRPSGGGSHRGGGVLADADSVDDLKRRTEPIADSRGVAYYFAGLASPIAFASADGLQRPSTFRLVGRLLLDAIRGLFALYLAVIIGPSLVGHGMHHRSRSRAA